MAQITCASPVSLKVTSVAAPGGCDPRLNSLPLLAETMLWGTVSSLANVTDSPFLMVMLSDENRRPFWVIVRLAARAPADRPTRTTTARDVSMRIGIFLRLVVSFSGGESARWSDRDGWSKFS